MAALMQISTNANNPSVLAAIKSTKTETTNTITAADHARLQAMATLAGTDLTTISSTLIPTDANKAADLRNHFTQAVIEAKEGEVNKIKAKVGACITDTILCTNDGTDEKGIDDFKLHELIQTIHQHAERPKLAVPCSLLVELVSTKFDF